MKSTRKKQSNHVIIGKGMARNQKRHIPPNESYEITAPKALSPLMQAFHVDTQEAADSLIMEAARAIFGHDESGFDPFSRKDISSEELEGITSLMRGINPRDTLETLYAAQIVASHMLGMRKLSASYPDDQKLGLKLLRFSNEAMQQLEKKRNGGTQNITVNYNYHGQGNPLMQTVIPIKEVDHADSGS
jgi:hypothetical protein